MFLCGRSRIGVAFLLCVDERLLFPLTDVFACVFVCARTYAYSRALVMGFPLDRSPGVASLMAGERSSSALLYMIGQCDPIIIFQGHVSGRVLVVAPVWERPGSVEGGPWVFCLVPTVGPFMFGESISNSESASPTTREAFCFTRSVSRSKLSAYDISSNLVRLSATMH